MSAMKNTAGSLEDARIPVKLKLSAAWVSLLFLYAYGDIFAYFRPGFIDDVRAGEVFLFEINQVFLLAISIYVAIPAVMVLLSLVLEPRVARWANIVAGAIYAATIVLSTIGEDYIYYAFLSLLECALALLVVWYAWKWPRESNP